MVWTAAALTWMESQLIVNPPAIQCGIRHPRGHVPVTILLAGCVRCKVQKLHVNRHLHQDNKWVCRASGKCNTWIHGELALEVSEGNYKRFCYWHSSYVSSFVSHLYNCGYPANVAKLYAASVEISGVLLSLLPRVQMVSIIRISEIVTAPFFVAATLRPYNLFFFL